MDLDMQQMFAVLVVLVGTIVLTIFLFRKVSVKWTALNRFPLKQ